MSAALQRAQSRGHSQAMQPPSSLTVQATGRQASSSRGSCRLCSRSRAFPPGLCMFKCQYGQPAVQGKLVSSRAPGFPHAIFRALLAPSGVVRSQFSLDIRTTRQPSRSGSPRSRTLSTFPTSESGAQAELYDHRPFGRCPGRRYKFLNGSGVWVHWYVRSPTDM